jgi:2-polyprenyl-3-methyl-5-hydroxy-6-metoxy-1,4-benzoquinol methylase
MKFEHTVENTYWNNFYKKINDASLSPMPPSQFAAFCCSELRNRRVKTIVDIASGDGRDSMFFAEQGFDVYSFDKSKEAVEFLKSKLKKSPNLEFFEHDVVNNSIPDVTEKNSTKAYYARFFIHVLEHSDLLKFFNNLSKVMRPSDYLFVEYRNEKDISLAKVTPKHFRNFYKSDFVTSLADQNNLECTYEVEGQGFAKWKEDDAFVTRQVFIKTGTLNSHG